MPISLSPAFTAGVRTLFFEESGQLVLLPADSVGDVIVRDIAHLASPRKTGQSPRCTGGISVTLQKHDYAYSATPLSQLRHI